MTEVDLADRYRGAMLGLVAGNVLGVPVEGRSGASVRDRYPDGVRDIDPDEADRPWDDDVAQAIILAEALVERGELSLDDLGERFLRWYREGARGIGMQTAEVMRALEAGTPPTEAARLVWERSGGKAAGNGAVMRCAPVALRWRAEVERLVEESRLSARITHEDPRCQWSAAAFNLALGRVLEDDPIGLEEMAADVESRGAPPEVLQAIRGSATERPSDLGLDGWDMGFTLKTMQVGLRALVADDGLEEGLVAVVSCGGDTDTNGAVAGAALGARYGAGAIPDRWAQRLPGRDRLVELAEALLEAAGR